MLGHPNDHLARCLIKDRLGVRHDARDLRAASAHRRQRALVEASLLIVGDRRQPDEHAGR
jgi:hypothetical protein